MSHPKDPTLIINTCIIVDGDPHYYSLDMEMKLGTLSIHNCISVFYHLIRELILATLAFGIDNPML